MYVQSVAKSLAILITKSYQNHHFPHNHHEALVDHCVTPLWIQASQ